MTSNRKFMPSLRALCAVIAALSFTGCVTTRVVVVEREMPVSVIRVGLIEQSGPAEVSAAGGFWIRDGRNAKMTFNGRLTVKRGQGKDAKFIMVGKYKFAPPVEIFPQTPKTPIMVKYMTWTKDGTKPQEHRYRGEIVIRNDTRGGIIVVNRLNLDEYLYGVLPREVYTSWPMEALKAQAVVSRTFILTRLQKFSEKGYDVTQTQMDQVYGGYDSENERTNQAVEETMGEVITYKGNLAHAIFHNSCGGRTEDPINVWAGDAGKDRSYLRGVICKYCTDDKWYRWETSVPLDEIARAFQDDKTSGRVRHLEPLGKTRSGRAREIRIRFEHGEKTVPSNAFRIKLNPSVVRSTNFRVYVDGNKAVFKGTGWGHGVGFCQWGSRGLAARGRSYSQILSFYYPGVRLERWRSFKTSES